MAYNYTDLTLQMKIDPQWLADGGTVYVGLVPDTGTSIEVTTTSLNPSEGIIVATVPQNQSKNLHGVVRVQCNGFLNGARWATEKKLIYVGENTIERTLTNA